MIDKIGLINSSSRIRPREKVVNPGKKVAQDVVEEHQIITCDLLRI